MSPLQIEILLHLHWSPIGFRGKARGSPSYRLAISTFQRAGLIKRIEMRDDAYVLTPIGLDCVERLMAVPMLKEHANA